MEGIGAPGEIETGRLKGTRLKGLLALSELEVCPEVTAVGLGRKQEARLREEEPGTAERMDPHWILLGMHWEQCSQEGTTRSRGAASQSAVDAAAAAAEVSDQRFESSVVSIAVASAVEGLYDR